MGTRSGNGHWAGETARTSYNDQLAVHDERRVLPPAHEHAAAPTVRLVKGLSPHMGNVVPPTVLAMHAALARLRYL